MISEIKGVCLRRGHSPRRVKPSIDKEVNIKSRQKVRLSSTGTAMTSEIGRSGRVGVRCQCHCCTDLPFNTEHSVLTGSLLMGQRRTESQNIVQPGSQETPVPLLARPHVNYPGNVPLCRTEELHLLVELMLCYGN